MTPSWSGSAGSGWVAQPYQEIASPAGKYKVAIWNSMDATYHNDLELFFGSNPTGGVSGPVANNVINGLLTIPNQANAKDTAWDDGSGS